MNRIYKRSLWIFSTRKWHKLMNRINKGSLRTMYDNVGIKRIRDSKKRVSLVSGNGICPLIGGVYFLECPLTKQSTICGIPK